jgi:hypothetical protein
MPTSQQPAGDTGFFYCDFWRSRSGHIWAPLAPSYQGVHRSADMQAMLSPYRLEVDQPSKPL